MSQHHVVVEVRAPGGCGPITVNVNVNGCSPCDGGTPARLLVPLGPVSEQSITPVPIEVEKMILTDTQQVRFGPVVFKDKKGKPAKVQDGSLVVASSDPAVLSLTLDASGDQGLAVAGDPGTAQLSVKADADLGDGVTEVAAVVDFEVLAGQAVTADIPLGTPEEQP